MPCYGPQDGSQVPCLAGGVSVTIRNISNANRQNPCAAVDLGGILKRSQGENPMLTAVWTLLNADVRDLAPGFTDAEYRLKSHWYDYVLGGYVPEFFETWAFCVEYTYYR
jgi:hypothetical protein